jgi:mono/diheme cytochrome c family protein
VRRPPRTSSLLLLLLVLPSCRRAAADDPCLADAAEPLRLLDRFERDADFRRRCLLTSLGDQQNQYARDRVAHYRPDDWGALPLAAFRTRPVLPSDVGRPPPMPDDSWQVVAAEASPVTRDGLRRRGEQMFTRFPAQLERSLLPVLRTAGAPARYGLWQTADSVGGVVWVALPGGVFPSLTCSSCHASLADGGLRPGVPNHQLDLGKAKDDYVNARTLYSTWGPGREDIAADGQDNPVVIADLRPVRFQSHLHRTANVRNSLVALALRVETGLVTAHFGKVRPASNDAFALAYYLWTLGDALDAKPAAQHPGREAFDRHCGGCHRGPALAGPPLLPAAIRSPLADMPNTARGTGKVRTPSLLGVSGRRRLLYGGEADGIDGLLDPARTRGGHSVGASLTRDEREAIAAYLRAL